LTPIREKILLFDLLKNQLAQEAESMIALKQYFEDQKKNSTTT
jgi:hypothetical protein